MGLVVNAKKKEQRPDPLPTRIELQSIHLKPFTSDYSTFVHTTSAAMGVTGPVSQKSRPNMFVLSLANLGSPNQQE